MAEKSKRIPLDGITGPAGKSEAELKKYESCVKEGENRRLATSKTGDQKKNRKEGKL